MLHNVSFLTRGSPTGCDSNDIAHSEGGVRIVNQILLRIGKPLRFKASESAHSSTTIVKMSIDEPSELVNSTSFLRPVP